MSKVVSQVLGLLLAQGKKFGPFYFNEKSFAFVVIIFFRLKFASKRNNVPYYISRS